MPYCALCLIGKVFIEGNQCIAAMVSSHLSPWTKPATIGSINPSLGEVIKEYLGLQAALGNKNEPGDSKYSQH